MLCGSKYSCRKGAWALDADGTLKIQNGTVQIDMVGCAMENLNEWGSFGTLRTVDLTGSGVRSIDKRAFGNSRDIQTITFPGTLETIGQGAFMNCILLQEVDLSHTRVKIIKTCAFELCDSLQTVRFPLTLGTISVCAFLGSNLREVDLSHTRVRIIEKSTFFSSNSNFQTVRFPSTLETIKGKAFGVKFGSPIGELTLSDGILIAPTAFSGCTLVEVVFFRHFSKLKKR